MNTLQTDFLIIRKSTKNLFKINMIKKNKKKKSRNYISTFDRILTKTETVGSLRPRASDVYATSVLLG